MNNILNLFADEMTEYAIFKNYPDPKPTVDELKVVIESFIASSYNVLPD